MNEISLSEISFKDKNSDWIEISVNSKITKTYQIRDDGLLAEITPISDIDYIIIHFKSEEENTYTDKNIHHIYLTKSGLTGTTEQITIKSDSKLIDATCWKNSSPTKSELEDMKELNIPCIDSESIKSNQSIAFIENSWQIFPHPTPGKPNFHTNSPPLAKISIQKGKLEDEIPFSINLDSSESLDPDGDELTYKWEFPTLTSNQENPPSYRFETSGKYEILLTITDPDGLTNTDSIQITAKNNPEDLESKQLLDTIIKNQKPYEPYDKKNSNPSWLLPLLILSIILLWTLRASLALASNYKQSEPTEPE